MTSDWLILHGGALGDLVLTIQLALRLPGVAEHGLHLISRVNPGDLALCRPRITRQWSEGLGLHWLFSDSDDPPPSPLAEQVRGRRVLSALGGPHTIVHQRLLELRPAALYGLDPRPAPGVERHITEQWRSQLEQQGLLIPKCIHQRPAQRSLGVSETVRARGRALLAAWGAAHVRAARPADPGTRTPVFVIHPGSGGRRKCWPSDRFIAVARELREQRSAEVVFLLGPVELETWSADEVALITGEFAAIRSPTADELVAALCAADVFVGNDAGPTHLAALLGTRTVAVFGATSATIWRPLGQAVTVVVGEPSSGAEGPWPLSLAVASALGDIL